MTKLNRIRALCQTAIELGEKATSGPWSLWKDPYSGHKYVWSDKWSGEHYGGIASCIQDEQDGNGPKEVADGDFIAFARSFTPAAARALLVAITRLELRMQCEDFEPFAVSDLQAIEDAFPDL